MGFSFRKRNPKGLNVSLSSRGLRLSKTIKMGDVTYNIGRYFGGSHDGKTTGRVIASNNGFEYRKEHTLFKNKKIKSDSVAQSSSYPESDNSIFVDIFLAVSSIVVMVAILYINIEIMSTFPLYKEFVNSVQKFYNIILVSVMTWACFFFIKKRLDSERAVNIYKALIVPVIFEIIVIPAFIVYAIFGMFE